ncbi:hypothetical protein QQF64_000197 [Cirrhinus molitorella]|uniref:Uncharacterized protein n=1 Tax=Cirrhinus molitorella TaxID=172907 RepID=A0ABR3NWW8_9TELE
MVNIGETATFSCEYSQNHINDLKIIFKEEKDSIEMICSTRNGGRKIQYSDEEHRIHLQSKVGVSRVSSYSGGGLMIKCEHPQYKTKPKYICKEPDEFSERRKVQEFRDEMDGNGDVSYMNDTRAGVLIVFLEAESCRDAGTYRLVCVDLCLIRWILSDLWKLKHKRQDPGSVQMKSNDDLPTIPSDGLLYAAVSFQKHEESLSDAAVRFTDVIFGQILDHVQMIIMMIYPPQFPSDGLLYAAVSFQEA